MLTAIIVLIIHLNKVCRVHHVIVRTIREHDYSLFNTPLVYGPQLNFALQTALVLPFFASTKKDLGFEVKITRSTEGRHKDNVYNLLRPSISLCCSLNRNDLKPYKYPNTLRKPYSLKPCAPKPQTLVLKFRALNCISASGGKAARSWLRQDFPSWSSTNPESYTPVPNPVLDHPHPKPWSLNPKHPNGSFRKLGVPYFGVLIIRILVFRVLY